MIQDILNKAVDGHRLSDEEALTLLQSYDLAAIGAAADKVSRRMHPESYRTYNIDRNINYTNICTAVCNFCAFYRGPKSDEGYVLPREELLAKVGETVDLGGNQILMQGGLHPKYKLGLVRTTSDRYQVRVSLDQHSWFQPSRTASFHQSQQAIDR